MIIFNMAPTGNQCVCLRPCHGGSLRTAGGPLCCGKPEAGRHGENEREKKERGEPDIIVGDDFIVGDPLHLCFEGVEAHVSLQIASLVYWHGFHSIQLQMLSAHPERLRDPKTLNPNKRPLAPLILLSLVILHLFYFYYHHGTLISGKGLRKSAYGFYTASTEGSKNVQGHGAV